MNLGVFQFGSAIGKVMCRFGFDIGKTAGMQKNTQIMSMEIWVDVMNWAGGIQREVQVGQQGDKQRSRRGRRKRIRIRRTSFLEESHLKARPRSRTQGRNGEPIAGYHKRELQCFLIFFPLLISITRGFPSYITLGTSRTQEKSVSHKNQRSRLLKLK